MRKTLMVLVLTVAIPAIAFAHGGGMGSGGGMMGGSGMMVVADDSSLLVTNMDMSGMMHGGSVSTTDREIVNIGADGTEQWRISFDDGWPMMPVTNGDLVIVVLVDRARSGRGRVDPRGPRSGDRRGTVARHDRR
jgi:hypothetical protein